MPPDQHCEHTQPHPLLITPAERAYFYPRRRMPSGWLIFSDGGFFIADWAGIRKIGCVPMQAPLPTDRINLRLKKSLPGDLADGEETSITLSNKLNELFRSGYAKDDIYGLVIPLLMQGKVRIDLDGRSERLEMEDQTQKLPRTSAVQIFEDFLLVCRPEQETS